MEDFNKKIETSDMDFSDVIVNAAKRKRAELNDEEYNDWLCELSREFAAMFYDFDN